MGVSYGEADRIAKMIEAKPGVSLKGEYEAKPELKELIESSTTYQELWAYALKLEGLTRNVGIHAAGVVIGNGSLDEHVPLTLGNEGEVVTQYDMSAITEVGLLKMDFLGLKNLTVIHDAVGHIRQHTPGFDIEKVPLDDQATFEILLSAAAKSVSLEAGGPAVVQESPAGPLTGTFEIHGEQPVIFLKVVWADTPPGHRFAKLRIDRPGEETLEHVFSAPGDIDDLWEP